jgi:hypothetical protein
VGRSLEAMLNGIAEMMESGELHYDRADGLRRSG